MVTARGTSGVSYTLASGDKDHFRVDVQSGAVTSLLPLDYEQRHQFQLVINAYSNEVPLHDVITCIINIDDVNDNRLVMTSLFVSFFDDVITHRPQFDEVYYEVQLQENPSKVLTPVHGVSGPLVLKAHDRDSANNGLLNFRLAGSDVISGFTVDSRTGAILQLPVSNPITSTVKLEVNDVIKILSFDDIIKSLLTNDVSKRQKLMTSSCRWMFMIVATLLWLLGNVRL